MRRWPNVALLLGRLLIIMFAWDSSGDNNTGDRELLTVPILVRVFSMNITDVTEHKTSPRVMFKDLSYTDKT